MRPVYFTIIIVTFILVVLGNKWFTRQTPMSTTGSMSIAGTHDECLSCHNGYISDFHTKCTPVYFLGISHPDKKGYPPPERKREFKSVADAEKSGIMFVDGKIDCISCHSLRAINRDHLRIENAEKQLCYACHIKLGEVWGR